MATAEQIRRRNHVNDSGAPKPPMLFAHGFGCDQTVWSRMQPTFDDDYRTIRFDHVGSGCSDVEAYRSSRHGSLQGYALDLIEVIEACGCAPVILVAHSVAGMIGLLAANQRPELFRALVMLGPSPCYLNDPPDYMGGLERKEVDGLLDLLDRNQIGWARMLAPLVMGNPDRPELGAELESLFCRMRPGVAREFARVTFLSDCRADLRALSVPALILQLQQDAIAPRSVGDYLRQNMPGSALRTLAIGGHCPHISHPRECAGVIREWLASL